MRIYSEGNEIELIGIQGKPSKVIGSNSMKKLIHGLIAQLCSLDPQTSRPFSFVDLQKVINNHSKVFREIPKGLPPTQYQCCPFATRKCLLTLGLMGTHMHKRVRLSI
jgi:hypothetical protein